MIARRLVWALGLVTLGCGGGAAAPTTPTAEAPQPSAPASASAPAASTTADTPATPTSEDDGVSDRDKAAAAAAKPVTVNGVTKLPGLFDKSAAKSDFPSKVAGDKECLTSAQLSGKGPADFEAVIRKCGAPTGMKPYVNKIAGKLDAKHQRDVYSVTMLGGFCYRFFAIGDNAIGDMNIRVQSPKGALVSMVSSKQAVAVLDPDEQWCKTHDREFHFVVESPAGKTGDYVFGVYARPK